VQKAGVPDRTRGERLPGHREDLPGARGDRRATRRRLAMSIHRRSSARVRWSVPPY